MLPCKTSRFTLLATALALFARPAVAQVPDTTLWVTNGTVFAMARSGNTLYVGGTFTRIGPSTGGGVPFGTSSATPIPPFAKVAGTVDAVVPDGSGGWFIGGKFSGVQGVPRSNLAHVLGDGSVAGWSPDPDSVVRALALSGSILYAGGTFDSIAGQPRNKIAAVDATTGEATAWDPSAQSSFSYPSVNALAVDGGTVYAGGLFTALGHTSRRDLAALDAGTGLAIGWNPNPDGPVNALALSGTTIYAGGQFSTIGGHPRNFIAALDSATGTATAWDPNANSPLTALAVSGTAVYAGGFFTGIGGMTRNHVAKLSIGDGRAIGWNPNANGTVAALSLSGSTLYSGGSFTNIGGQTRTGVAALDTTTGLATAWQPDGEMNVQALALQGPALFVGGQFSVLSGAGRGNLAALDLTTGAAAAWSPVTNGPVRALAVGGTLLYVGGTFSSAGGQTRNNIAALDLATGAAATGWNPGADNQVTSLVLRDTTLYLAGYFTTVGSQAHPEVAAVGALSGAVSSWKPTAGYQASGVAVSGSRVYVASQSGPPGTDLVALDAGSGGTLWGVGTNGSSGAVAVGPSTVYLGGNFQSVNSTPRPYLAAVDSATGALTAWTPSPDDRVTALASDGSTIYAGGDFGKVGGQPRSHVAAIDAGTAAPTTWHPDPDGAVYAIVPAGSAIYLGGSFASVGYFPQASIAAFPSATLDAPPLPQARGPFLDQNVPNPARSSTVLRFALAKAGPVSLGVFDLQGRRVAALLDQQAQSAGPHQMTLRTSGWRPGLYFLRLEAGGRVASRKVLIVK